MEGQLKLGCWVLALNACGVAVNKTSSEARFRTAGEPDLLRQPEREALDNAAGRLAANGLTFERDMSFPKPTSRRCPSSFGCGPTSRPCPYLRMRPRSRCLMSCAKL